MNTLRKISVFVIVLCMLIAAVGCNGADMGGRYPSAPGDWINGDSSIEDGDIETGDDDEAGKEQEVMRKQLTAAEWNDGAHYEFWQSLFASGEENQGKSGAFYHYAEKNNRGLDTAHMHTVTVTDGVRPIAGAKVKLYGADGVLFSAVSDANGLAVVFGENPVSVEAESGGYAARAPFTEDCTVVLSGSEQKRNEIEILFVVDTTGSMSDELSFLKKEIEGIILRVSATVAADVRLGMLFYRDDGDAYVTRAFEFADANTSAQLKIIRSNLNAQTAAGGGDIPEAVDRALDEAVHMQWSSGSTTKLLFHILDAPYHDEKQYQQKFASAVYWAAEQGIRIIPVAASGMDKLGEYIMRSAALLTGGTYTFLTDDSGIGDSHDEPTVDNEYVVEYLSDLLVRLTIGYHTGEFPEPVVWKDSESYI